MRVYIQGNPNLTAATGRTVYNMALHDLSWLQEIRERGWKYMLVHGGFQGKMASFEEIVAFTELDPHPELVIAPDYYREFEKTIDAALKFSGRVDVPVAAVIQLFEFDVHKLDRCLNLYDLAGYDYVAIPSDSPIVDATEYIKEQGFKVHILGGRSFVKEADSVDIVANDMEEAKAWIFLSHLD